MKYHQKSSDLILYGAVITSHIQYTANITPKNHKFVRHEHEIRCTDPQDSARVRKTCWVNLSTVTDAYSAEGEDSGEELCPNHQVIAQKKLRDRLLYS